MIRFCYLLAAFLSIFSSCADQQNKKIPIAILTPITHRSLEQIEKGFKETLEAEYPGKYQFVTYNAQGNKILMRGEVEEIAQRGYRLVFTIGTMASQMVSKVFAKKGLDTPIVFTAVNDPIGFSLISSEQSPGGYVTGVKELLNFKTELEFVLKFKPNIKTVLLIYNPMEPGLTKDQIEIDFILKEKGINLITAEVFQTNEFMTKISAIIKEADAVLILKDNTAVGGVDVLVKLCTQYRIPLIASDLDSPDRGAAFGYGVHEFDFGVEGAKKAVQILDQQTAMGEVPVTSVSKFMFKVNREAAIAQGIAASVLDTTEIFP